MSIHQVHKVLIVGVGSIGERHLRCFQNTGRAELSICETNDRLRREVADKYEIDKHFSDFERALAEPPDAAVIAVPADLHVAVAIEALNAGLHVLIEKPLSVTLDGVDELAQTVARAQRKIAVAYVLRTHPSLAQMKQLIASGTLGAPVEVVAVAGQNFPTYRPAYRQTYYASRARGGGAIQDALTHQINAVEWLVGPVDRVVADADHKIIADVEVEDVVHCLARHGNVLASYSLNQFQSPNEVTITVVCERGTLRFEYHNNRFRKMHRPDEPWQDTTVEGFERDLLFVRQANSFLDSIDTGIGPVCSLDDGIQTLRVNRAILQSLERNCWQSIL